MKIKNLVKNSLSKINQIFLTKSLLTFFFSRIILIM